MQSNTPPLVVSVVLTWNDTELTTKCLSSVFASSYENRKVILVDNGSTPPCGPQLQARFPEVTLIQLESNQGFSGGANRGIEKALEMGADYVHLIGNDSTLAVETQEKLIREMELQPKVAAASPILLDSKDETMVQFYRASLDRELAMHHHHNVGDSYDDEYWPSTLSDFIPCVALCFRAAALRDVGLLDERFGTCWEDYDLCVRFHDAGWLYLTVGDAPATHVGSVTTGKTSPYITYYTVRNRLICLQRYSSRGIWRRRGFALAKSFWRNQIKEYGLMNWSCHWAFLTGVVDYLRNSRGESRDFANGIQLDGGQNNRKAA